MGVQRLALVLVAIVFTTSACNTISPTATPAPTPTPMFNGVLTGEIVYDYESLNPIFAGPDLPEEGFVALADVSGRGGTGGMGDLMFMEESDPRIIAKGAIDPGESRIPPVAFTINYNPSDIDPESLYVVAVYFVWSWSRTPVSHSRGTHFTNLFNTVEDSPPRVLTRGYPRQDVEVPIYLYSWIE